MERAPIGEAIELCLGDLLRPRHRDIETQLGERLHALVGDQVGGIVGAAEHPPPIAAQLRVEQRRACQLTIGADQDEKFAGNCCTRVSVASSLLKSTRPLRRLASGWPLSVLPAPCRPLLKITLT